MILDTIQHIDESILLSVQQWGHSSLDLFWQFVSNKWNSIPLYLLIIFLLFKKRPVKEAIFYLICIGLLITVSDQMAKIRAGGRSVAAISALARPLSCSGCGLWWGGAI